MAEDPTPAVAPRIWEVGALCRAIADALEARFNPVAVRGEISGFSRAASGHCYFSLKDAVRDLARGGAALQRMRGGRISLKAACVDALQDAREAKHRKREIKIPLGHGGPAGGAVGPVGTARRYRFGDGTARLSVDLTRLLLDAAFLAMLPEALSRTMSQSSGAL